MLSNSNVKDKKVTMIATKNLSDFLFNDIAGNRSQRHLTEVMNYKKYFFVYGNNENKNCFRPTEGNAASNPVLLDPINKAEIGMSEKPIQSQPKKSKRFRLKNSESKTSKFRISHIFKLGRELPSKTIIKLNPFNFNL